MDVGGGRLYVTEHETVPFSWWNVLPTVVGTINQFSQFCNSGIMEWLLFIVCHIKLFEMVKGPLLTLNPFLTRKLELK
jgi:hypothetical protein